ncbi:hypothetical protein GCM10023161_10720 [Mycobacterium paraffinicum]|uniref:non-specific serine/threonine protein kinase n=1 Tax=Mycobacterium paraffinicum TaxID=53378 RepID=A0ABP8RDT9_9MYCO
MEGTPFGPYRLINLLGRGGMGEVWRAYDTVTDRIVALKVLPANFAADKTFQQRFRREAHSAARLNNPHVVPIHTYGEIDGRLFVDMRLIDGRDLATVLASGSMPRHARCTSSSKWPAPCMRRTRLDWCIGISSPPTSCSMKATLLI